MQPPATTLTQHLLFVRPVAVKDRTRPNVSYGPWLVALGAALWGTESAWRIPLNDLFDAEVIVFWEHVLILLMFLPLLLVRLGELPKIDRRTWGFLLFSGFAGSAVGTIFFTLALKYGNPTVVNVILNIQPVFSTIGACFFFGDRLARRFFLFAGIAIVAGMFLSVEHPSLIGTSFAQAGLNAGTGYALVCAVFWGLSTVAGRGVMVGMSLRLAASLRIVVGLVCMTLILLVAGKLHGASLWPAPAQAHPVDRDWRASPAREHFRRNPASDLFRRFAPDESLDRRLFRNDADAGGSLHHLGIFPRRLAPHQVIAALVLIAAATMVQRVQEQVA